MPISPGDIVVLKSEPKGQKFTVGGNHGQTSKMIYWYDQNLNEMKSIKIHQDCLLKVDD